MLPNQAMNINHPTLRFENFYVLNSYLNFVYQRDQPCRYIFSLSNNIYINYAQTNFTFLPPSIKYVLHNLKKTSFLKSDK
jgi:hypothetical protein